MVSATGGWWGGGIDSAVIPFGSDSVSVTAGGPVMLLVVDERGVGVLSVLTGDFGNAAGVVRNFSNHCFLSTFLFVKFAAASSISSLLLNFHKKSSFPETKNRRYVRTQTLISCPS